MERARSMRVIWAGAVGLVVLLLSLSAYAADISIGVISPVTGPVALDGESFRHGAELAGKGDQCCRRRTRLETVARRGGRRVQAERVGKRSRKAHGARLCPGDCGRALQPGHRRGHTARRTSKSPVHYRHLQCTEPHRDEARLVLPLAADRSTHCEAAVPYYVEKLGFKSVAFVALNDEWGRQAAEANSQAAQ